jgi:hypothetical protein
MLHPATPVSRFIGCDVDNRHRRFRVHDRPLALDRQLAPSLVRLRLWPRGDVFRRLRGHRRLRGRAACRLARCRRSSPSRRRPQGQGLHPLVRDNRQNRRHRRQSARPMRQGPLRRTGALAGPRRRAPALADFGPHPARHGPRPPRLRQSPRRSLRQARLSRRFSKASTPKSRPSTPISPPRPPSRSPAPPKPSSPSSAWAPRPPPPASRSLARRQAAALAAWLSPPQTKRRDRRLSPNPRRQSRGQTGPLHGRPRCPQTEPDPQSLLPTPRPSRKKPFVAITAITRKLVVIANDKLKAANALQVS